MCVCVCVCVRECVYLCVYVFLYVYKYKYIYIVQIKITLIKNPVENDTANLLQCTTHHSKLVLNVNCGFKIFIMYIF